MLGGRDHVLFAEISGETATTPSFVVATIFITKPLALRTFLDPKTLSSFQSV
jgi:hypothetical protein